jgi:hypothetical protein
MALRTTVVALVKSLDEMSHRSSRLTTTVKRKGFLKRPMDHRLQSNLALAQVLFTSFPHTSRSSLYRRTPLQNIGSAIGSNNLFTAINFFVVLLSIAITLNPRDWRSCQAKLGCVSGTDAPLFACG